MVECSDLFIGMDVSKDRHAVAVADGGRDGEVRYFGEIGSDGGSVRRFVRKLERPGVALRFCYEAGPTGYGLQRLIEGLDYDCAVIAPSLIPRRAGERVKTNRRDAVKLARLYRVGELTEIWTPDEAHEAMRDLVRAREAAVKDRTRKRQEIRSFLLRHGKIYPGKKAWGTKYFQWLHELSFGWPSQKVVLHEILGKRLVATTAGRHPDPLPPSGKDRSVREIRAIRTRNNLRNPPSDNLRNNNPAGNSKLAKNTQEGRRARARDDAAAAAILAMAEGMRRHGGGPPEPSWRYRGMAG